MVRLEAYRLPGGSGPRERSCLGAAPGDQVALSQHVADRPAQIWEAALGRGHPLLEPGKAGHLARDGIVVQNVGGEQGI